MGKHNDIEIKYTIPDIDLDDMRIFLFGFVKVVTEFNNPLVIGPTKYIALY